MLNHTVTRLEQTMNILHMSEAKSRELFLNEDVLETLETLQTFEIIAGVNHPEDLLKWDSGAVLSREEYLSGDTDGYPATALLGNPKVIAAGNWFKIPDHWNEVPN